MNQQLPKIVVEILPNGSINVSGSIHDRILAFGMLECAKQALATQTAAPRRVEPMPAGILPPENGR